MRLLQGYEIPAELMILVLVLKVANLLVMGSNGMKINQIYQH